MTALYKRQLGDWAKFFRSTGLNKKHAVPTAASNGALLGFYRKDYEKTLGFISSSYVFSWL